MKILSSAAAVGESLGLPPGSIQLTLYGRKQLLAREHRGLLGYGDREVILSAKDGRVRILGSGLTIAAMDAESIVIRGNISGVEYD